MTERTRLVSLWLDGDREIWGRVVMRDGREINAKFTIDKGPYGVNVFNSSPPTVFGPAFNGTIQEMRSIMQAVQAFDCAARNGVSMDEYTKWLTERSRVALQGRSDDEPID